MLVVEKGPPQSQDGPLPLWSTSVLDRESGKTFSPFLGEGVGGSSQVYGMVLELPEASDFQDGGGAWPGSLEHWMPEFEKAIALFSGTPSRGHEEFGPLLAGLERGGLMCKPLVLAHRNPSECDYCQSRRCRKQCRVDGYNGPLSGAIRTGNAFVLAGFEARVLLHRDGKVHEVRGISRAGVEAGLRAESFVLAAGALKSPLLLMSARNSGPGAGFERLDAVGKYLMRHLVDLYTLQWPEWRNLDPAVRRRLCHAKAWGCDSLYQCDGERFGTVQSFGSLPDFDLVWRELREQSRALHALPFLKPLVRRIADSMFRYPVAASIFEDSPHAGNRVAPGPCDGQIEVRYRIQAEDRVRLERFRRRLKTAFGDHLVRFLPQAHDNSRLAHACGTCRMGRDPKSSVTDEWGKVHEAENLWVADSSVFPSSTGKNPSLLIAAHSLRLAERLTGTPCPAAQSDPSQPGSRESVRADHPD